MTDDTQDRTNWPQWLKDAETKDAHVEITEFGLVIWRGGDWHGGDWHGGDWLGGYDNSTRCMFDVRGSGDTIKVGCKSYTLAEAEALCAGGELPDEAPERSSEAGRLLRASVLAQIAWQRALMHGGRDDD